MTKKTETLRLRTPDPTTLASQLVIETADQMYKQTTRFFP